ncbi:hypothetical protein Droror1_Dr00017386 [Drosera rotundifolia]
MKKILKHKHSSTAKFEFCTCPKMSCNSSFLSFVLCIFLILHSFAFADRLFHNCSGANLPSNTAYSNLISVNLDLNKTTPYTGFTIVTDETDQVMDGVYGLALCRGDISLQLCATCIGQASIDSVKLCQNKTSAIVWYDHCLYKYTNQDFFGQIDSTNKFDLYSGAVAGNATSFNQKTSDFLTILAQNASSNTPTHFATGVSGPVDGSTKLFGLAQCTWDLTSEDCYTCLKEIIGEIPSCCSGNLGARIFYGSCYVRYETFNFIGS